MGWQESMSTRPGIQREPLGGSRANTGVNQKGTESLVPMGRVWTSQAEGLICLSLTIQLRAQALSRKEGAFGEAAALLPHRCL